MRLTKDIENNNKLVLRYEFDLQSWEKPARAIPNVLDSCDAFVKESITRILPSLLEGAILSTLSGGQTVCTLENGVQISLGSEIPLRTKYYIAIYEVAMHRMELPKGMTLEELIECSTFN